MIRTLKDFYEQANEIIAVLNAKLTPQLKKALKADHIAYKCSSRKEFLDIRELFEQAGAKFWNSPISDRSIAIIFLQKPLETELGEIWFLELSDQKPDGSQQSGFDHIEAYPVDPNHELRLLVDLLNEISDSKAKYRDRKHHSTWDLLISEEFQLRLEEGPLINTIKKREMSLC